MRNMKRWARASHSLKGCHFSCHLCFAEEEMGKQDEGICPVY